MENFILGMLFYFRIDTQRYTKYNKIHRDT